MINNIRNAFIGMLDESTWMDDESKAKAIEKVNIEGEDFKNKIRLLKSRPKLSTRRSVILII